MYINKALQHITNGNSASTDDLMSITNQFPYFAVPHVLLLLQQKNSFSSTAAHVQKLQVFSPNNTWLQHLIHETTIEEPSLKSIDDIQFEKNKLVEPINNYEGFTQEQTVVEVIEPIKTNEFKTTIEESYQLKEEVPVFEPVNFGNLDEVKPTEIEVKQTTSNTMLSSSIQVPSLETVRQLLQGKTPMGKLEVEETIAPTVASILDEPIATENKIPSYQFNKFSNGAPYNTSNAVSLSEEVYETAENIAIAEAEEELDNQDEPLENSKLSSVLDKQLQNFNKPIEPTAKLDFEKENYYTVDYFASQGIKIDLTKATQDKLTVQLRRFTDWLKQMKNTNPNPTDLGTDPELEKAIQNIAKTSLESREIVTETMADVFIKQGKVDKAIQLYIKLSFLDPHKSTYFAKKIEQLKGI